MRALSIAVVGLMPFSVHAILVPSVWQAATQASDNYAAVENLQPRFFNNLGSQRSIIKYGPFKAPSADDHDGMKSFSVLNMTPPCTNCTVTFMVAGLEYPNGTYANANTGMWLHHVIVANLNRQGTTCPTIPEVFFASGNERTPIDLSLNGTRKAGYYIGEGDTFALIADLMNEANEPRDAVVTIEWEAIPSLPAGFDKALPIWLDIHGPCLTNGSEVAVPSTPTFNFTMDPPWTADFSAKALCSINHLHDGGESILVTRNGQTVCTGVARYGESPGYVEGMGGMGGMAANMPSDMDMRHLSSINSCAGGGEIKPGDKWSVKANYNITDHAPMLEGGTPAPVMGISVMYVIKD